MNGQASELNRMPKSDVFVMIVFFNHSSVYNLALRFTWSNYCRTCICLGQCKTHSGEKTHHENGIKHYEIYVLVLDPLLFLTKLDVQNDPDVVIMILESRVVDMSAIEALNKITERYKNAGKQIQLKHLSKSEKDCQEQKKSLA